MGNIFSREKSSKKPVAVASSISTGRNAPDYLGDADLPDLPPPVLKLFEEYSKIPAAQVQSHVREIVCDVSFCRALFHLVPITLSKPSALPAFSWRIR